MLTVCVNSSVDIKMMRALVIVATSGLRASSKRLEPSDSFQKCRACLEARRLLKKLPKIINKSLLINSLCGL